MKHLILKSLMLTALGLSASSVNATTFNVDHKCKPIEKAVKIPKYAPLTMDVVENSGTGIPNTNYTGTLSDGTILCFYKYYNGVSFMGVIGNATSVTVPDYIRYGENVYNVISVSSSVNFEKAPSVKDLTLPATITSISGMPEIDNLYVNSFIEDVNAKSLHKVREFVYVSPGDLSSYMNNATWYENIPILEKGAAPRQYTVDVAQPGEFAQTLLAMIDSDWKKVNDLVITGNIIDGDLDVIKKMPQLTSLDLSGATFEFIPERFLRQKGYNLKWVKIPEIKSIKANAFNNCVRLSKIDIRQVNEIGEDAFSYTGRLGDVVLPDSVKTIGAAAFHESGLTSVNIPEGVEEIAYNTFRTASRLHTITLPNSLKKIGQSAFAETNLETIDLKKVEELDYYVFENIPSLKEVNFGSSLKIMKPDCFRGCTGLTSVDLPATLESLQYPFSGCTNITSFTCRAIIPPYADGDPMAGVEMTPVKLFVPNDVINSYRQADGWKSFFTLKQLPDNISYLNIYDKVNLSSMTNIADKADVDLRLYDRKYGIFRYVGKDLFSAGNVSVTVNNSYERSAFEAPILIAGSAMRADNIITKMYFPTPNRWYFITFPYDVNVSEITTDKPCPFALRTYSGENRAKGSAETWINLDNNSTMKANQGYILCTDEYYVTFTFPSVNNDNKNKYFAYQDVQIPISEYPSEFIHNSSWNLVGNPFPSYLNIRTTFSQPVTIWDAYNRKYEAYSPEDDDIIINPYEAIFVQCAVGQKTLTVKAAGRADNNTLPKTVMYDKAPSSRSVFNLYINNGDNSDRTRVVFNDKAKAGYEINRDVSKLIQGEETLLLYTVENNVRHAINERPLSDGNVSLGVYASQGGSCKIEINNTGDAEVMLTDKLLDRTVSLSSPYEFNAEKGFDDSRFVLSFKNVPTTVDSASAAEAEISVTDGTLNVNAPYKVYSVDGKKIADCQSGKVTNLSEGVYVIVVNGERHKVIIK